MWISSCTLFMWTDPVQCLWVFPPVQSSYVSLLNSGYAEFPPVHWLCWWSCVPVVVVCFHRINGYADGLAYLWLLGGPAICSK
jgi:hypothetical protein